MTHPGETAHKQRAGEAEADACLELMRATVRKLVPHVHTLKPNTKGAPECH